MQSDFDIIPRILAFAPALVGQADQLNESFGSELPEVPLDSNSEMIRCLAGGRDQESDPLVLRALRLGITAYPIPLSDGRFAFCGYWTNAVLNAVQGGTIEAQELTESQFINLQPASIQ